jgi:copper transport protein
MRTSRQALSRQRLVLALLGAALLLFAWPAGRARAQGAQAAHALPVQYSPAQNAVLKTPPTDVQITFSEHVNPDISTIVVVNPSNQEVDNRDSQVSADGYTMRVSLPLLPAGTYVVFWRSHSADDGHVAGGSYLFHIARADGSVPPLSGPLPIGNIIGGAGLAANGSLDGPNLFAAVARWAALLALTLLLGMLFWSRVVQPRQPAMMAEWRTAFAARMQCAALMALGVIVLAGVLEVAAQALLLDGTLRGVISPLLWQRILLDSRFGRALLVRTLLAGIGFVVLVRRRRPVRDPLTELGAVAAFGIGLAVA